MLADGGVCCIDEFNMMRDSDKAAIHEAMEQQSISMAKAGLVCKLSTRCIVVAATNPKNMAAMMASDGSTVVNIGIASPLLSRFDVVLVLRDERDPDWDGRVAQHLLGTYTAIDEADDDQVAASSQPGRPTWTEQQFQTHLTAIRDICPTVTPRANAILGAYFRTCRADAGRDPARTTVRLLDSLMRLAQAHARLMFRDAVTEVDAVTVVRLMESSWGFGHLLRAQNIMRAELPIGPSAEQVAELKHLLGVEGVDGDDDDTNDNEEMDGAEPLRRSGTAGSDMFSDEVTASQDDRGIVDAASAANSSDSLLTDQNSNQSAQNLNRATQNNCESQVANNTQSQKRSQTQMDEILSWADFDEDSDGEKQSIPNKRQSIIQEDDNLRDAFNNPATKSKQSTRQQIVPTSSIARLNMFRNVKYTERSNVQSISAPAPKSAADTSDDSAYQSMLNSTVAAPSPSTTPIPPSLKLHCTQNEGNLDFLDDIDDI